MKSDLDFVHHFTYYNRSGHKGPGGSAHEPQIVGIMVICDVNPKAYIFCYTQPM